MSETVECPSCDTMLLGVTFSEALEHIASCCSESGYYAYGLKPKYADALYTSITGESVPKMDTFNRMMWYWQLDNT